MKSGYAGGCITEADEGFSGIQLVTVLLLFGVHAPISFGEEILGVGSIVRIKRVAYTQGKQTLAAGLAALRRPAGEAAAPWLVGPPASVRAGSAQTRLRPCAPRSRIRGRLPSVFGRCSGAPGFRPDDQSGR